MANMTTQFGMVGGHVKFGYFEDFLGGAINPMWVGTSTNSGTAAIVADKEDGVVGLITGATDNNYSTLNMGLNYKPATGGPLIFEAGVAPITNLTGQHIFVGFTDSAVGSEVVCSLSGGTLTTTATDLVGLIWSSAATDATHWYAVSCKGDADGAITLIPTLPVVAGQFQSIRVVVNQDGDATFFINEIQVAIPSGVTRSTARTNALTSTVLLTPVVQNRTLTGSAARTTYVDYTYVQAGRTN